jgi:hypothetical protein
MGNLEGEVETVKKVCEAGWAEGPKCVTYPTETAY